MIQILRTDTENKDFKSLIAELDIDLAKRYGVDQEKFNHHNKIKDSARVVVAYKDNEAVGCGCHRPMEDQNVTEVKRMYVKPVARGMGISKLILRELELWGKEEGYKVIKLETGIKQPEAISLYTSYGYNRIENYGPYKDIPESVCMSKQLDI